MIYAYHPEDPASENSILQHNHRNRGQRSVYLLNNANKEPTLPPDTKTFDISHNMVILINSFFLDLLAVYSFKPKCKSLELNKNGKLHTVYIY